ncbi:ABC transporter ATP-binding protein [Reyranella sp. CPCC 100927]|nr:ABC transporter ATP-binding protein [Reyranella sp. CPCC 100927]
MQDRGRNEASHVFSTSDEGTIGTSNALTAYAFKPLAFILRYVRHRAPSHTIVILSVLVAVGCAISSQYAIKHLIDVLSSTPDANDPVWTAFMLLTGLIAADNLSWRVGGWAASHAFVTVTGDLRRDLFRHLTGHAHGYFVDRLPGMLASRITATANAVYTTETMFTWNVMPPAVATMGSIALLSAVDPTLAGTLVVIAGIIVLVMFKLASRGQKLHHTFASKAALVDGELVDIIGNIGVVRAFGATMRERQRFATTVHDEMDARQRSLRYLEKLRLLHAAMTAALTAGVLGWALLLWQRGAVTTGDVVLVCALGFTILHASRDLAVALVEITQHVARLGEALSTLLLPHEMREHPDATSLSVRGGRVEFDGVDFSYPGSRPVLRNFRLQVAPGQRVGLVGRSGSGKSTVLALMQRFYDVQHGCIRIGDQDVRQLAQQSLGDAIALVPQDISLFHRSILENIRYGRPDATEAEVEAAAEAAGCKGFIAALPQGFATIAGDRGVKLSGGQRQRIAIARAFLKDAPILLLDEATSALDSESEQAIHEALARLMRDRTVIAIAHRLSTLRDFDRIVVMDAGRIVQDGTPSDLARRAGPFRDLLQRQMAQAERVAA